MNETESIEMLKKENADLRQWVHDCQSGMYVNCVYCGHRYGPSESTPVTQADILKEHISQCAKHPMSQLIEWIRKAAKYIPTMTQCQCQGEHDCESCQLRRQAYEFIGKEGWQEATE